VNSISSPFSTSAEMRSACLEAYSQRLLVDATRRITCHLQESLSLPQALEPDLRQSASLQISVPAAAELSPALLSKTVLEPPFYRTPLVMMAECLRESVATLPEATVRLVRVTTLASMAALASIGAAEVAAPADLTRGNQNAQDAHPL
jgi:hypothetical protein